MTLTAQAVTGVTDGYTFHIPFLYNYEKTLLKNQWSLSSLYEQKREQILLTSASQGESAALGPWPPQAERFSWSALFGALQYSREPSHEEASNSIIFRFLWFFSFLNSTSRERNVL